MVPIWRFPAQRDGDSLAIKVKKSPISMADQADAALVFVRTGPVEAGAHGISAFLLPINTPGISTTRFKDLSSHAIGRGSIFFDQVRLSASHLLGEEGMGFVQVTQGFDYSRALIGLQCCAAAPA